MPLSCWACRSTSSLFTFYFLLFKSYTPPGSFTKKDCKTHNPSFIYYPAVLLLCFFWLRTERQERSETARLITITHNQQTPNKHFDRSFNKLRMTFSRMIALFFTLCPTHHFQLLASLTQDCKTRAKRDCKTRAKRDCKTRAKRNCKTRAKQDCKTRAKQDCKTHFYSTDSHLRGNNVGDTF
mgnify:CR=1 FL=1